MLDPSAERFDRCVLDVAQTPADAISLIAKHELDWQLLILDIDLRNGSGFDVMKTCQSGCRISRYLF
jgi:DNA-binding response OmpR family regulator